MGIVHNQMRYEPKNQDDCSSLYVRPVTDFLYSIWSTDKLLEFFRTGAAMCGSRPSWAKPSATRPLASRGPTLLG